VWVSCHQQNLTSSTDNFVIGRLPRTQTTSCSEELSVVQPKQADNYVIGSEAKSSEDELLREPEKPESIDPSSAKLSFGLPNLMRCLAKLRRRGRIAVASRPRFGPGPLGFGLIGKLCADKLSWVIAKGDCLCVPPTTYIGWLPISYRWFSQSPDLG
jgi:hypothetical protein